MNPREEDLARVLADLGLSRAEGRVVAFLSSGVGDCSSLELAAGASLSQPEVSVATTALRRRGWVRVRSERRDGPGRPLLHYALAASVEEIACAVDAERREHVEWLLGRLERLRRLTGIRATP